MIKEHGGNVYKISRETGRSIEELVDFSANINPLGIPQSGEKAIVEGIKGLVNYPDPDYTEFCRAVGAHHQVDASWVIPGNGAIDSLYAGIAGVGAKRIMVSVPSFVEYERAVEKAGAQYIPLYREEAKGYAFEISTLKEQLEDGIDLIVICNPNNPTGDLISRETVLEILDACRRYGAHLLLDEAFMEFAELEGAQSAISLLEAYPELIISRSLTKFYAVPGLRAGYLLTSSPAVRDRIKQSAEPWKLNYLADVFSRAVLEDAGYADKTRAWLTVQKNYLLENLQTVNWLNVQSSHANYLFLKCKAQIDLKSMLLEEGVMIRSCSNYDGMAQGYYRVAVKDEKSNAALIKAIKTLDDTIKDKQNWETDNE